MLVELKRREEVLRPLLVYCPGPWNYCDAISRWVIVHLSHKQTLSLTSTDSTTSTTELLHLVSFV